MNPLEQVNKCQNYIMFIQLHQDTSKITSQSKTSQTGRISELEGEKFGKKLCAPRQFLCASCHFETEFEALLEVQIEPKWTCWKVMPVYFPTQVEFLNLVPICPSKTSISQGCFLCVKLGTERSFLTCFWPPEDSKLAQISCPSTKSHDFPCWIQKCKPFVIWSSQS